MSIDSKDPSETREVLTQRANLVRSRMLRRIDLLQARRRAVGRALRGLRIEVKHVLPAAAGVLVVFGAGIVILLRARAARARRHQGWLRPAQHDEPGLISRAVRGLAVSLLTRLALRVAERAAHRYFPAQRPPRALPQAALADRAGI